jgi:two-component system cell cycle response regulator CtrA
VDVDARLDALEDDNDRLRERIAQLEDLMGMNIEVPLEWGLTGHERAVFGVIMARTIATKDAIMAGIYRDTAKEEAEIKIVDVFVCKIRKKLKPFAIDIETVWGVGYRLSAATKAAVRAQMGEDVAVAA